MEGTMCLLHLLYCRFYFSKDKGMIPKCIFLLIFSGEAKEFGFSLSVGWRNI